MDSHTDFKYKIYLHRNATTAPVRTVALTCTEIRHTQLRLHGGEITNSSIPDKNIVRHYGYFPFNKPNDFPVDISRSPNGIGLKLSTTNPSDHDHDKNKYYTLNCARDIWLILRRFGLSTKRCSIVFRDIDKAIKKSSSSRVIQVKISKLEYNVYNMDCLWIERFRFGSRLDQEENTECVICLKDYEKETLVANLPCGHVFHGDCILKWTEKSTKCPLCRFTIPHTQVVDQTKL
ncbi:unnamed protein product [Cochlearia groenlandica]